MATIRLATPSCETAEADAASMKAFIAAVRANNPFAVNRVSDPSQMDGDVTPIHNQEFERLVEAARDACDHARGRGALLLGGAGTGKSHLLARLARWASVRLKGRDQACFVFLHNIRVSPPEIGRYLLKRCINELIGDRANKLARTRLYSIIESGIRTIAAEENIPTLTSANFLRVRRALFNRIGGDEAVFEVIFQLFGSVESALKAPTTARRAWHQRNAAIALRWLEGDVLDAEDASLIGKSPQADRGVVQLAESQLDLNPAYFSRECASVS